MSCLPVLRARSHWIRVIETIQGVVQSEYAVEARQGCLWTMKRLWLLRCYHYSRWSCERFHRSSLRTSEVAAVLLEMTRLLWASGAAWGSGVLACLPSVLLLLTQIKGRWKEKRTRASSVRQSKWALKGWVLAAALTSPTTTCNAFTELFSYFLPSFLPSYCLSFPFFYFYFFIIFLLAFFYPVE